MHETSIAEALLEQVRRHTPSGSHATIARVQAGPLQGIDPQALEWAWKSVTAGTELAPAALQFTPLPWSLACPRCGRAWTSEDPFDRCSCGADALPSGSNDLRLISLEVEPLELSFRPDTLQPEY